MPNANDKPVADAVVDMLHEHDAVLAEIRSVWHALDVVERRPVTRALDRLLDQRLHLMRLRDATQV